jgi:epoxyqueuosine reductase
MREWILKKARDLGFIAVGFSRPGTPPYFDFLKSWIASGKHGDMAWFERRLDIREDPTRLLKNCRTVISLAFPYPAAKPATPDGYTVSRYALPDKPDYHDRLRSLCREIAQVIRENREDAKTRTCVDSAPIMERSFALSSGMGFIGKNNALIIPGHGSYLYLAEILTTAAIDFPKAESMESQCGSCTRCIEACPAGALTKPFDLDARKCLSYLTIEYKGVVSVELGKKMGRCFFGCDRCQEVCPFNGDMGSTEISLPGLEAFLAMEEDVFEKRFGKTALSRPGLNKLKENIRALWSSERSY